LNYPIAMTPKAPEGIMPRTWQAPDFGFYGFRNKWTGSDDQFITQFFSSTYEQGASTLRVAGLGHVWSHGLKEGVPGNRFFENVVQLPNDSINIAARGKVTHLSTSEDGSGSLTIDLSDLYTKPLIDRRGQPVSNYEYYGRVRREHTFMKSGITGSRAMAVDYSGKSGAPCMIVIVDRIDGAKDPIWSWQLDSEASGVMQKDIETVAPGRPELQEENFLKALNGQILLTESKPVEEERIRIDDHGFTFTQGQATMRATFITPAKPKIEVAERMQYTRTNVEVIRHETSKGIFVTGGDHYFTILTFQNGPAPKVEVIRGQGLDAVVRVGDQTVRFDGEKIIIE